MNQLIRQAQSEKGFSQIILLGIVAVLILAGGGGFLVFREKKTPSPEITAVPEIVGVPKFIQADFIDLSKIFSISKFRSGSGHDFSRGSGETCRSMKHYFNVWRTKEADRLVNKNKGIPPPPDGKTDIPIYSPVDGKVINIESEQVPIGQQIYIQPDLYPNFTVRLFHIYPLSDIKKSVKVKAGQKIGVVGQYQNTDIAITQGREKYISYFEVMPDNVFAKYQALGVKNRKELIISKEERDANLLKCNGEWFVKNYDSDPSFENFIYLNSRIPSINKSVQKTSETNERAIIKEHKPPILKNFGIKIEPWNKATNRAGDFLLENKNYVDNKIFTEFAHKIVNEFGEKLLPEIGFNVPVGTKVVSPIDGVITDVKFYEPSQDYLISIKIDESSPWIVGFEHVHNIRINVGDKVLAGQDLAEVSPSYGRTEFGNIEINVWTAGQNIIKYCPFEFLDESLKLLYEEKINQLAKDWEEFIGKDVYKQEEWVAPGCLLDRIQEQ